MIMAVIGIDSHKDVLTGCLVDASGVSIEQRSIANTTAGHAELVAWARSAGVQRVGIEGAGNYGRPATVALIGAGVPVVEVPPQMTAAARRRRRTRTKTDPVDALEIARISARDDDLPPPRFVGACDDLAALVRYRRELVKSRTAALNRLHSTLEKIRCGYHNRTGPLTSGAGLDAACKLLRGDDSARAEIGRSRIRDIRRLCREIDAVTQRITSLLNNTDTSLTGIYGIGTLTAAEILAEIGRSRIRDIRRLCREIDAVTQRITSLLNNTDTSLTGIYGIGTLTAAEILAEVGDPARFATKDRFAMANGNRPHRGQQRTSCPTPAQPRRQPPTQPRHPHRRHRPDQPDPAPKAAPTTNAASTAAKTNEKPSDPSNGASQTASGNASKTTSNNKSCPQVDIEAQLGTAQHHHSPLISEEPV